MQYTYFSVQLGFTITLNSDNLVVAIQMTGLSKFKNIIYTAMDACILNTTDSQPSKKRCRLDVQAYLR